MSDAVGGRLNGRKNQFLHHDYVESNLKKHKYRMTTVIKSKDLLPKRTVIMMSHNAVPQRFMVKKYQTQGKEIDQWQGG